ncbi:hypothetical protein ASZ78_005166, partial [Callipepla squamata]
LNNMVFSLFVFQSDRFFGPVCSTAFKMDNAERSSRTGCLSYWTSWALATIHCHAVSGQQLKYNIDVHVKESSDSSVSDHTKTELDAWRIVRVSEDFRVIALGLPVPKYSGNPLDPPLRSRFQARDIYHLPFKDHLQLLYSIGSNISAERISQILSFATTLCSQESSTLGLPDFPLDSLSAAVQILDSFPMMSVQHVIDRLYPYNVFLGKEGRTAVEDALKRFELQDSNKQLRPRRITKVESVPGNKPFKADVTVQIGESEVTFQVPSGTGLLKQHSQSDKFIRTSSHDQLLAEMMQSHMVKDMCLIGGKGCGKTVIAKEFADILGYSIEPIMLYQVSEQSADDNALNMIQVEHTGRFSV